jgi:hypothetical protein
VQAYPFEPVHDFCFSRFDTQFFENPGAGLRNMRNCAAARADTEKGAITEKNERAK